MHLFFPSEKRKQFFLISGEEHRHLRVKRIHIGEEIGVIFEEKIYRCVLREKKRDFSLAEILEVIEPRQPQPDLTLYQSLTHHIATVDFIVQKSVELGVLLFVPLLTERSFRNLSAIERRIQRWKKIIREAMKQCGRAYPMELTAPVELSNLEPVHELNLLLDSFYEGVYVKDLNLEEVKDVAVVVGPEGGFTEKEAELLREKGFLSVKLKPHILRTETAAVVAAGIIMNLAGS